MSDRNLGLLSNGVGLDKDCLNPKALFFNESLTSDVLSTPGKKISSKSELDAGKKSASVSTLLKILSANTYKILCETAKQCGSSEKVDSSSVDMLIDILVNRVAMKFKNLDCADDSTLTDSEFTCMNCFELLYEPVTMPCGHSFCKKCIAGRNPALCKVCKLNHPKEFLNNVNVNLTSILQKWHSTEYIGRSIVIEGDELSRRNMFVDAIMKYSEALEYVPYSHMASHNRAKAYIACGNLDLALEDAIRSITLARMWPESYLVKGEILLSRSLEKDALLNFLFCLALDPKNCSALSQVKKIVTDILQDAIVNPSAASSNKKRKMITDLVDGSDSYIPCSSSTSHASSSQSLPYNISEKSSLSSEALRKRSRSDYSEDSRTSTNESSNNSTHKCTREEKITEKDILKEVTDQNTEELQSECRSVLTENVLNSLITDLELNMVNDFYLMSNIAQEEEMSRFIKPDRCRVVDKSLIEVADLECSLCMRLFYEPTCTTCGHVFCSECIKRSLDHSTHCPLCKTAIKPTYGSSAKRSKPAIDISTSSIIQRFLPIANCERVKQYQEEIKTIKQSTPIFVCTTAFPSIPCPLHIFEPRYRLMLRRVMEIHDKEFGICTPSEDKPFNQVGTLLHVKSLTYFPDGRSVVDSVGTKRFRTESYGSCDGYDSAKISYIIDEPVQEDDVEIVQKLTVLVYNKSKQWFEGLLPNVKNQFETHYGNFPEKDDLLGDNGPNWAWWVLAVLPVENKIKVTILSKTKVKERLLLIIRVLTCLKQRQERAAASSNNVNKNCAS